MKAMKSKYIIWLAIIIQFSLIGCSASGPKYLEVASGFPQLSPTKSRVFFLRPYYTHHAGADARIVVDKTLIGESQNKSFFFFDFDPGLKIFTVDYWGGFGEYTEELQLEPGKTNYALITPYSGGLILDQLIAASIKGKGKNGDFKIEFIEAQQAIDSLKELAYTPPKLLTNIPLNSSPNTSSSNLNESKVDPDVESRLRKLDDLKSKKLINEEDYIKKKKDILTDL
jgi:hypothetical protein